MKQIVSKLMDVLKKKCFCDLSTNLFGLMQFRCTKDDKVVIVRGRLIGLPTTDSSELMIGLQEWVNTGPSIVVNGTQFDVQEQCTVYIDNLNATDCVLPSTTLLNKLAVGVAGGVAAALFLIISTVCVPFCFRLKGACKSTAK